MTTDHDFNPDERHGDAVRRAYAGVTLTPEQRRRHRILLAGAARRRGTDRFRFHAAEIGAIAAVALLAILMVFVWQSLDPGSDEAGVAGAPPPTEAEVAGTMILDPTPSNAAAGTPGGTPSGSDDEQLADQSVATVVQTPPGAPEGTPGGTPQIENEDPRRAVVIAEREAAVPFPPPATCPVSAWAGPEDRFDGDYRDEVVDSDDWTYSYFLDGSGISLNSWLGLLFEGENFVYWITARTYYPQDTVYRAERLDGESEPAAISFEGRSSVVGVDGDETLVVHPSTITFPSPGCWRITVESQDSGFRHTVYVYPEDERPE